MIHSQPTCGQFVWYNLVTDDPDAAGDFYGPLFGWTTRDLHAGGSLAATTFRSGECDVGGLVRSESGPAHWLPILGVEDVRAALSKAGHHGGSVVAPAAGPHGVAALPTVVDPTGARICLASASGAAIHAGGASIPGRFCWSELLTSDPPRAAAFYAGLVGWTALERDFGEAGRYWLFRRGDRDVAGMAERPGDTTGPSCWLPYVQVMSAEATADLAAELGGHVVTPPGDVPGRGRFAVVEDPDGARVAVFTLTDAA